MPTDQPPAPHPTSDEGGGRQELIRALNRAVKVLWDADDADNIPNDPERDVWNHAAGLARVLRKYGDVVRDEVWAELLRPVSTPGAETELVERWARYELTVAMSAFKNIRQMPGADVARYAGQHERRIREFLHDAAPSSVPAGPVAEVETGEPPQDWELIPLTESADWEAIAARFGGTLHDEQDICDEYATYMVLPGGHTLTEGDVIAVPAAHERAATEAGEVGADVNLRCANTSRGSEHFNSAAQPSRPDTDPQPGQQARPVWPPAFFASGEGSPTSSVEPPPAGPVETEEPPGGFEGCRRCGCGDRLLMPGIDEAEHDGVTHRVGYLCYEGRAGGVGRRHDRTSGAGWIPGPLLVRRPEHPGHVEQPPGSSPQEVARSGPHCRRSCSRRRRAVQPGSGAGRATHPLRLRPAAAVQTLRGGDVMNEHRQLREEIDDLKMVIEMLLADRGKPFEITEEMMYCYTAGDHDLIIERFEVPPKWRISLGLEGTYRLAREADRDR